MVTFGPLQSFDLRVCGTEKTTGGFQCFGSAVPCLASCDLYRSINKKFEGLVPQIFATRNFVTGTVVSVKQDHLMYIAFRSQQIVQIVYRELYHIKSKSKVLYILRSAQTWLA